MKEKICRSWIHWTLILLPVLPAFSQGDGRPSDNSFAEDSIECGKYLSTYREFVKYQIYEYAMDPWRNAFDKCRASSEKLYVDGVTMYRHYIEEMSDGPIREGLVDTLMLIYDRRMEYFGGEGNVSGRKGIDLLTYRKSDPEQLQEAYALLKKSIELEGIKTREAVMLNFISAGIALENSDLLEKSQIVADHFMVMTYLDKLEERSSRWTRTHETIDEIMAREKIFSCEALDVFFGSLYEQNKNDLVFLRKMTSYYEGSKCGQSDTYLSAAENLYSKDPGPESAHDLAILHLSRNDLSQASKYLQMAVIGENIDSDTRAQWLYKLAVVKTTSEDYCAAIGYAREALNEKREFGKAYLILGDAILAARSNLGDSFEQRTAFWAAADKYREAALADPSLAEEAREKLADARAQFPDKEEVFFRDLKEGDSYKVGGCIDEYTAVRTRD